MARAIARVRRFRLASLGGARKMKISFPGYNQAETLSNFPALVVLGPTNGFAYSQVASANGWDLLFLSADETQELNYEIESWNTNGASYVWVELPQLATDTFIWACWGDRNRASAPAPYLTNGAVWANGYAGVWHRQIGLSCPEPTPPEMAIMGRCIIAQPPPV